MQVVEHQHERLPRGQDHEQVADRLVRAMALVGEAARALAQDAVELVAERLQHRRR